ncbi:histidine kinase [Saprospiraceae bacterium]|nr:histidine kinase [Saprospiraceae bacterium]
MSYQKKKHQHEVLEKDTQLREQALIIERQKALENERTRIAAEMHDDLGGGLTTIRFLSQRMLKKIQGEENVSQAKKIVNQAESLVSNMSEIIWAMNSGFDTLESLIAYTRRYASEYLETHNIDFQFLTNAGEQSITLSGEQRRNLFLVIKEALHNIVKHAQANTVEIAFSVNDKLNIMIKDNGQGSDGNLNDLGNGLINMRKRIEKLGGIIEFKRNPGFEVLIQLDV